MSRNGPAGGEGRKYHRPDPGGRRPGDNDGGQLHHGRTLAQAGRPGYSRQEQRHPEHGQGCGPGRRVPMEGRFLVHVIQPMLEPGDEVLPHIGRGKGPEEFPALGDDVAIAPTAGTGRQVLVGLADLRLGRSSVVVFREALDEFRAGHVGPGPSRRGGTDDDVRSVILPGSRAGSLTPRTPWAAPMRKGGPRRILRRGRPFLTLPNLEG